MPLPMSALFHDCPARIRLLDGSNQSGKTLTAQVEIARAICGLDPKYPRRNGLALIVGKNLDHVGDPMWRTLAEPGAFSIIRDEHTRIWRSVRPDPANPKRLDPYDEAYREKWVDAPPLLPRRMIKSIAWEAKGKGAPRVVNLTTGWKMLWHTADGDPRRGIQVNLWNFDEEIKNRQFLPEALRGCMRHGGKGFWSATAQTGGAQLYELHRQAEGGSDDVKAFTLLLDDNPHYTDEEKKAFYDQLSEDEREVRYFGKYALAGRRVYSMFNAMDEHGVEPFTIPPDWTREVIVDPSRQYLGCLFGAIDPDEQYLTVYDGFVMRQANKDRWADMILDRQGKHRFERFIIDQQMGKQTFATGGDNVAKQYWDALKSRGIEPRLHGPDRKLGGFFPGSKDVMAREESLIHAMRVRYDGPFKGTAQFRVMRGVLNELERQINLAHYGMDNPDKRVELKGEDDLIDCVEYWAASRPGYHLPETVETPAGHLVWDRFQAKQKRAGRHSHRGENLA